jgi:hypothetical protein
MNERGEAILNCLRQVGAERARRAADPALAARVSAVKRYQHERFARSYADLLSSPRYERAARFFLEDLYGPGDFTRRDDQFARVVPGMVRIFGRDLVATVGSVASLHALSEQLDSAMGEVCGGAAPLTHEAYASAWRQVARATDRARQIDLILEVGQALDRYTRKPLLRQSLHLMAGPARAAGLEDLHAFLASGFDTFREMRGADEFLATIATRERALAAALFGGGTAA